VDQIGNQELRIKVDGMPVDVFTSWPRPDVARHLDDPEAANCGFIAKFKTRKPNSRVAFLTGSGSQEIVLHKMPLTSVSEPVRMAKDAASNYLEWIIAHEPDLFWHEEEIGERLSMLSCRPLISIVVPTYNASLYFLKQCIGSVLAQRYVHLELCVSTDDSRDPCIREYLHNVAVKDGRINVIARREGGGISVVYNDLLQAASGELIVFLHQNDELHPFALLELVRYLNANANAQLIYSDEDKIDYLSMRCQPAFKPDFDIDMLLSFNYIGHLCAVNKALALHIGGFRSSCDGAQDWDFLLRLVEHIDPTRVHHIRKPLYHRRLDEGTTPIRAVASPSVLQRVLLEHTERTGKKVTVEAGLFCGSMRVHYDFSKRVRVGVLLRAEDGIFQKSVIRPNLTERETTIYELVGCVVRRAEPVLWNASGASIADNVSDDVETSSRSYSAAIGSLDEMNDDVFIFINGPLETINHFFIEELISQAMRGECGLVSGISIDTTNRILHSGFVACGGEELVDLHVGASFPGPGHMGQLEVLRQVDAVSHHVFATRREHLAAVGGIGSISASHMPQLVSKLVRNASKQDLRVLVTPYAVATFDSSVSTPAIECCGLEKVHITGNPNLLSFDEVKTLNGYL
jgi:O-antigen biosynthesis protein